MKKVLLISHFNYSDKDPIHGPIHNVAKYFSNKKIKYKLLELPLYAGAKSFQEVFDGKNVLRSSFGSKAKYPLPLKSFIEILQTLYKVKRDKFDMCIAADPLNAFSAIIIKKLRIVKKVTYFTVDYAEERFGNNFINSVYHLLDKFCITYSDQVWNVSSRIYKKREEQGLSVKKNLYVPNSPKFDKTKIQPDKNINRFEIVMVSGLTHTPVFQMTLQSIKILANKYPKVKMSVIGSGPHEVLLRQKISKLGLKKKVEFLGQMNHESLMNKVSRCGIGLAIYTKDFNWTHFGDSMKAREYLAVGVPVIISDVVSTAEDIKKYNAGVVIKPNYKALSSALDEILKDKKNWLEKRTNGLRLAKEFDFDKIIKQALLR